jgi:hypothetical protein
MNKLSGLLNKGVVIKTGVILSFVASTSHLFCHVR